MVLASVLNAVILVGGSIAVALINRKVKKVHEEVKTHNGRTVGEFVDAQTGDVTKDEVGD